MNVYLHTIISHYDKEAIQSLAVVQKENEVQTPLLHRIFLRR